MGVENMTFPGLGRGVLNYNRAKHPIIMRGLCDQRGRGAITGLR